MCVRLALTSCKSTELLVKSSGSSVYDGVFTRLNTSYAGRPVFRHDRHRSLHLHYSSVNCSGDPGAGAWVVADGLGSAASSTSMFAVDSAVDPATMSPDATWFVYDRTADQFLPDSRIGLACYVPSAADADSQL